MNLNFTILIACLVTSFAHADTPEEIARDYYQAFFQGGFSATVDYLHSDTVASFKETLMPVFRVAFESDANFLAPFYGPETTLEVLERSNPRSFLISFIVLVDEFYVPATIEKDGIQVVGTIPEREDQHVLLRITWDTGVIKTTQIKVVSLRKEEGSWRVMFPTEILVAIDNFRAEMAASKELHNKSLNTDASDAGAG